MFLYELQVYKNSKSLRRMAIPLCFVAAGGLGSSIQQLHPQEVATWNRYREKRR
jgi:hypothetical protein